MTGAESRAAPDAAEEPLVCATCGAVGAATARATWSRSLDGGAVRHHCPACSREHARSMEAKLDPRYW